MSETKISVITVYNDQRVLEEWLLDSLSGQDFEEFETITIDNRDGIFPSAAEALNYGASQASGEYYVFIHQDVRLLTESWLQELYDYLSTAPELGMAGVTGMAADGECREDRARNIIFHGRPPTDEERKSLAEDIARPWTKKELTEEDQINQEELRYVLNHKEVVFPATGNEISEPELVQTVDELLMAVPSDIFDERSFNTEVCDGWHLYGVEYALYLNYRSPHSVYVLPLNVWHRSTGLTMGNEYYKTLDRIVAEYKDDGVKNIYATTGDWPVRRSVTYLHRFSIFRITNRLVNMIGKAMNNPRKAIRFLRHKARL
ncbi:glycosyltransferase [Natronoarchaeum mannanilyticum]|uniref:Streptomycin biosynthesis protein StrF domain-containing protein n=1 Tax=Natronoarchaeum mannanilyticum TaxID=926360 RepID=A0AAV3T8V6_9EURY